MKIYHGFLDKRLSSEPRSITIGVFDGVHRGHQRILGHALARGAHFGAKSTVVTFDPHPVKVLHRETEHPILMSLPHRLRQFEKAGIRETLIVRFNRAVSKISHEKFLKEILLKKLGMVSLSVGYDFCFGRAGEGNIPYLKQMSARLGFDFAVVPPLKIGRQIISSTRIRQSIEKGELARAAKMLGRPVSVYGTVIYGRGRGKSIHFPTANLNPHHETLPPSGVYSAWGYLNGRKLKGIIHIGARPTFQDKERSLEVHFLDFYENIYGKELELVFVSRLRSTRRFSSPEELAAAIQKDAEKALQTLF